MWGRNPLRDMAMLSAERPEDVLVRRAPGGGLIFIVLVLLVLVVIWALLRGSGDGASPSPSPSASPSLPPSAAIAHLSSPVD